MQFIFLCNPQKSSVNVYLMTILKSTVTEKVIACFNNLGEENSLKVAAFVIFPTSIMVLLEIHQRFKGRYLNELRVTFKVSSAELLFLCFIDQKLFVYFVKFPIGTIVTVFLMIYKL